MSHEQSRTPKNSNETLYSVPPERGKVVLDGPGSESPYDNRPITAEPNGPTMVTPYYLGRTPEELQKNAQSFNEHTLGLAEFFTGFISANRSQWFNSIGHVVQGLQAGRFLQPLKREYETFRDAGKIKEDFRYTDQNRMCFSELLRFLEQDIPDKDRFELLKRIYIVTATEKVFDRQSHLPLQFMQIARGLTSGEILVLFAANRLESQVISQDDFIKKLVEETGLQYKELVIKHFESVFNKSLISKLRDLPGVPPVLVKNLLTPLGKAFCDYVVYYDGLLDGTG